MEAVDNVAGDQERDAEAGLLYADALHLVHFLRVYLVQYGTDLAFAQRIGIVSHIPACGNLVHLSDLLCQSHL